jgi:hypothetical protein
MARTRMPLTTTAASMDKTTPMVPMILEWNPRECAAR